MKIFVNYGMNSFNAAGKYKLIASKWPIISGEKQNESNAITTYFDMNEHKWRMRFKPMSMIAAPTNIFLKIDST